MSGLPLRHRGAHLPDYVRQLGAVGSGAGARAARQSLVALHHQPRRPADASDFATLFTNLAVWVDAAVRASAFHVGTAKAQLYVAFLRVLVEELMPDARLHEWVQLIDAYVSYLLTDAEEEAGASPPRPGAAPLAGRRHTKPAPPYVAVKMPPAPRHQPMAAVLSPRVLQQIRRAEPTQAKPQSPVRPPTRPIESRTLVELSDHEEAVLELALFFHESLGQLVAAQHAGRSKSIDWDTRPKAGISRPVATKTAVAPLLTNRWPQLSADAKKRSLTGVKRKLSRQKFFSSLDLTASSVRKAANRRQLGLEEDHSRNVRAGPAPHTKIKSSRHLSLILLCLHETIRLANVFSQEMAQFAWLRLCEEPMEAFERALLAVENQRTAAIDELQRLRSVKEELQTAINECEARIQRLQTRSMASASLWHLEQSEAEHLAREERWHGHCKALMLRSLAQVAEEANLPTWCELNDAMAANHGGDEGVDNGETTDDRGVVTDNDDAEDGHTVPGGAPKSPTPDRLALAKSPRYECLAPGAALLDPRLRFQLMYISHLLILCRSYLHLHDRRPARDVVEATATAVAALGADYDALEATASTASAASAARYASDSPPMSPTPASHLLANISRRELETLKELNEALRAFEVVYATTIGERPLAAGGAMTSFSGHRSRFRFRDASTQFPQSVDGGVRDGIASPRGFLRSLAYCTIAATSFTSASSFVPSAIDMSGSYHNISGSAMAISSHTGSGRRHGSAIFKAQGLAADTSTGQEQQQLVMLRLDRAVQKLPKHMKELLLLLPPSSALPSSLLNGCHNGDKPAASPFASISSATGAGPSVVALSGDELVVRIQAVYRRLADAFGANPTASSSPSWSVPTAPPAPSQQWPPALGVALSGLVPSSQQTWPPDSGALRSPEALVHEVYALFLDAADGAIDLTEREFVRFFASIQLFVSKSGSGLATSSPPPAATPSVSVRAAGKLAGSACHEVIHLFAILTKLYYLPAPDRSAVIVPPRLFAVVNFCQRMLEQVALDKKRLQVTGGGVFDIWVASSSCTSASTARSGPPSVLYSINDDTWPSPSTTPLTPTAAQKPSAPSLPPQPYVLLDSAKLLLVHVAGVSSAPSSVLSLKDSNRQLESHAIVATASLANSTTPAPYQVACSSTKAGATGFYSQPNGLLTDIQIVPLQVAVAVIARGWLGRVNELQRPLRVAFRAALAANSVDPISASRLSSGDEGRLSFSEFLHAMTNGQPHKLSVQGSSSSLVSSSWEATANAGGSGELTYTRLAQLYSTATAADGATRTSHSGTEPWASLLGVRWTTLARVVVDELDLTNTLDRFAISDMRSIEHALIGPAVRSGGSGAVATALQDIAVLAMSTRQSNLLPWLLRPPYTCPSDAEESAATVSALTNSWSTHSSSMSDRFAGAAQADGSAIDGVLSWQIGRQRHRLVGRLLPHGRGLLAASDSDSRKGTDENANSIAITAPTDASGTAASVSMPSEATRSRKLTIEAPEVVHEQLSDEQVGVIWTSFYYLQLEHAHAHQLMEAADRTTTKQQQSARSQKATVALKAARGQAGAFAAVPTSAASPVLK